MSAGHSKSSGKGCVGVDPELQEPLGWAPHEVAAELLLNPGAFQSSHLTPLGCLVFTKGLGWLLVLASGYRFWDPRVWVA